MSAAFQDYSTNDQNSSTRSPEERLAEATAFLTAHFGRMQNGERFCIDTFANDDRRAKYPERNIPVQEFSHREFTANQIDAAARYAIRLSETHDVYASMAVVGGDTVGFRFSKASVTGGYSLWAEIDYEAGKDAHMGDDLPTSLDDALTLPDDFGVEPSEVISSGHGIHCHWFLDGSLSRDELAKMELGLVRAIKGHAQQKGWSVDSTFDLARVLRVPGTINHKKHPVLGDVTYLSQTKRRYDVDTLREAIERSPKPVNKVGTQDFDAKAVAARKPLDASDEQIIWETSNPSQLRRWLAGDISDHKDDISGTEWAAAMELAQVGANIEQIDRIIGSSPLETARKDKAGKWWKTGHSAELPGTTYGQLTAMRAIARVVAERADPEAIARVNAALGISVDSDTTDAFEAVERPVTAPAAAEMTSDTPKIIVAPTAAKVIDMAVPAIQEKERTENDVDANTISAPISIEQKRKERQETPKAEKHYPCSDEGNARRFADLFKDRLRYLPTREQWLIYDGTRWAPDERLEHVKLARTISDEIERDAKKLEEQVTGLKAAADPEGAPELEKQEKHLKALRAWAKQSQTKARIDAAWNLARTDLSIRESQLDAEPDWLNVKNGTINLRTGVLMPHSRDHYLTKIANVKYNPSATSDVWENFLETFTSGHYELKDYLQRAIGYSLLGSVREEKLFVLYGDGANGKSTFMGAIKNAIGGSAGGYSDMMSTKALMTNKDSANVANPYVVKLKGARFVTAAESQNGAEFDEAGIKAMVSRDDITARGLHKDPIVFPPTHTIWLSTNYKPRVPGRSEGIWRRLVLINTDASFRDKGAIDEMPESEQWRHFAQDVNFDQKLHAEAEAILAWAVKGCLEYLRIGFKTPVCVTDNTRNWRLNGDYIADFVEEYLTPCEGAKIAPKSMRAMLVEYWDISFPSGSNGKRDADLPGSGDMVNDLARLGIRQVKGSGKWTYRNWRVKTPEEFIAEHPGQENAVQHRAERLEKWRSHWFTGESRFSI